MDEWTDRWNYSSASTQGMKDRQTDRQTYRLRHTVSVSTRSPVPLLPVLYLISRLSPDSGHHQLNGPFHNFMLACAYLFPSGKNDRHNVNKRFLRTNSTFH